MTTSRVESASKIQARSIRVADGAITVDLADGRTVIVPLAWYPRLADGTPEEQARWEMIGKGIGLHWPDLDEDISVEDLLDGLKSGESEQSFGRWLEQRRL